MELNIFKDVLDEIWDLIGSVSEGFLPTLTIYVRDDHLGHVS